MSRKFFAWLKKNLLLKILSGFFAVILWTYVMAVENPQIDKLVTDVPVRFTAEDVLLSRNLIVRGDRTAILPRVNVLVNIERSYYSSVTSDALSATLALGSVVSSGSYTLPINTTTPRGTTISTTPSSVKLEIDQLASKTIPVRIEFVGELPAGYWAGKPELVPAAVQIKGAMTDIERVRQGVCVIDLDNLTRAYNDTLLVELRDEHDEPVENSVLLGEQPSIIVKMEVLPKKTVGFDLESVIVDSDKLPRGFQINGIHVEPTSIDVVGEAGVLEALQKLSLEQVTVQGEAASLQKKIKIKTPDGVTLLGSDEVELFVDISEQIKTAEFETMPIEIVGLQKGLVAEVSESYADVVATGRVSLIEQLTRANLKLPVDVTGLPEGEYMLEIKPRVTNQALAEVTLETTPTQVVVNIKKK